MEISLNQRSNMVSPVRKILRWALTFIGGVTALAISIIVVGILINLKDEPLDSKAKAMRDGTTNAVDPKTNGYFVLIAMDADEGLDALKTGQEAAKKYAALANENPFRIDYIDKAEYKKAPPFTWLDGRCKNVNISCLEEDILNRTKLETLIAQNSLLLKRYEMIEQLSQFEEPPIISPALSIAGYSSLLHASDLTTLKAVFDIADGRTKAGIERLAKNDQFIRRLMLQSSTLTSKMVITSMLQQQTRVISELVEAYPNFIETVGDVKSTMLRPLSEAELSLVPALKKEAQFVLTNLTTHYPAEEAKTTPDKFSSLFLKAFYQPNATVNMMANYLEMVVESAHVTPAAFNHTQQQLSELSKESGEHSFPPYVHNLYNPFGKILYQMLLRYPETYVNYMERVADLDGYIRLVGLQAEIRRKGVTDDAIQNFVATADSQFRSPYDATPMTWAAQKKQLQFVGRQNNSDYKSEYKSDLSGRNIYLAQLH
ncbi:hypothetical protein ACO0K0_12330 [Undibacterium sp. SXout11W]|uniref:hypothetical protein n=1 Tax=Undibacterium sp. SXout11W TaxID=3413050 RepID=UPI003BF3F410